MSNLPELYIAKAALVAFNGAKFNQMTEGLLKHIDDACIVKPSMLHVGKDLARAGMGAKMTPYSFVQGLLFLASAFACGQGKVDALVAGLPDYAAFAVRKACEPLKGGAGATPANLRTAVELAMIAVCGLPARQRAKKTAELTEKPAIDGQSTRIDDTDTDTDTDTTPCLLSSYADGKINRDADPQPELAANAALDAEYARAAKLEEARKEGEAAAFRRMRATGESVPIRVSALCDLATELGIKLTKAQLAQLDKLCAEAQALVAKVA